jgi:hypothetical protein
MIREGKTEWEDMLPESTTKMIKEKELFRGK